MKPGEYFLGSQPIQANAGRRTASVLVRHTGDRPVQIGSHYHFFEVNNALVFEREEARGMRLNIAAGTSVRFEPGEESETGSIGRCGVSKTALAAGVSGRAIRIRRDQQGIVVTIGVHRVSRYGRCAIQATYLPHPFRLATTLAAHRTVRTVLHVYMTAWSDHRKAGQLFLRGHGMIEQYVAVIIRSIIDREAVEGG